MATSNPGRPKAQGTRLRWRLASVLVLGGVVLTAGRFLAEPDAAAAPGDRMWDVELRVAATAREHETAVELATPHNTRHLRVVGQQISHPGWRQRFRPPTEPGSTRRLSFVASHSGSLHINAVFSIHASAVPRIEEAVGRAPLTAEAREPFLTDHPLLKIEDPAVTKFVADLQQLLPDDELLPDAIYDQIRSWRDRPEGSLLAVPDILAEGSANPLERAYAMVALSRAAHIPARLVKGLVLKESPATALHYWVEVRYKGRWVAYDPAFGYRKELPPSYLPFAKGIADVVSVSDTPDYSVGYAISNTDQFLEVAESTGQNWFELLELTRLPLETRIMLASLLLLPFGVVLTVFFSEVVGIRCYGVFTPTLLALSLVYVPWQSAAVVFGVVLLIGMLGRTLIPGKLRRAPRLAIVLTFVALGIGASASVMEYAQIGFGGHLILLPVVVLASVVDRFHSVFDERGVRTSVVRLGWTLVVAVLCIPIVRFEALGHTVLRFPELHLVTLGAILVLSLYHGKRLTDRPIVSRWLCLEPRAQPGDRPAAPAARRRRPDPPEKA